MAGGLKTHRYDILVHKMMNKWHGKMVKLTTRLAATVVASEKGSEGGDDDGGDLEREEWAR